MNALTVAGLALLVVYNLCAGIMVGCGVEGDRYSMGRLAGAVAGFCGLSAVVFWWIGANV